MRHESKFSMILRFNRWFYLHHMKLIAKILDLFVRIIFSADIPSSVSCPKGLKYCHYGLGIVVHPRAVIGEYTKIYQNVTIGCRNGIGPPKIGSNCEIGAGAAVLGDIVIGDYVKIGANAVVVKDIPSNCTVVGVPGRIIKSEEKRKDEYL